MLSDTPKLIIPEGLKGPAIRGALKALEAITLKTKFNTFVIVGISGTKAGMLHVLAKCDCGTIKDYGFYRIKAGKTKSCGCLKASKLKERLTTHGDSYTSTYESWEGMKRRCLNPKAGYYYRYGGRGIKVCDEWMQYENFKRDIGLKPTEGHTIERIDINGDYCLSNCTWVLKHEQAKNTRRNVHIEVRGKTMIQNDLAKLLNVSKTTIRKYRLNGKLQSLIDVKLSDYEWLDEGGAE